jgi:hypothetical protein
VERRKIETKLAREEAVRSKAKHLRENGVSAIKLKMKIKSALVKNLRQEAEEISKKKVLVKEVREDRIRPRVAEEKVKGGWVFISVYVLRSRRPRLSSQLGSRRKSAWHWCTSRKKMPLKRLSEMT